MKEILGQQHTKVLFFSRSLSLSELLSLVHTMNEEVEFLGLEKRFRTS